VAVNASAVHTVEGEILYYKGTVRDVTERKQQEEQLHAAHEQVLSIIESLPDATFAVDNEKKVIAWNKAMEQMTGVEKRFVLGKGDVCYSAHLYGKPRPMLIDLVFEDINNSRDEFKFVCREGDKLFGEAYVPGVYGGKGAYLFGTASPLVDASGHMTGAIESIRPITEIKRIEKELQESEERYRVAIENSPDGIAMVKDGRYLYVNTRFLKIFGFENAGEVQNRPLGALVDPNDLPALVDLCDSSYGKNGTARQYTFRGVRKDGQTVFIEASITGTTYLGEPVSLAYFQDITLQRAVEKALVEAENRYRGLFQNLPDGFVLVDEKKRIIEANAALQAMVGYRRDELLGLSITDLTPQKWHSVDDLIWRQVSTKGFSDVYEKEYIRKDGRVLPVEARAHLLKDGNGNPAGMWGIIRDITRRKQWEETLRETEERYRKVVHLSPIGIFIHVGGRVQFTNPAFALMIGAEGSEQLIGTPVRSFVPRNYQDLVVKRMEGATAEGSEPPLLEQKWVRVDGTVINVEARAFPFNYEGRGGIMVVAEDITQRKRAEQALRNREKELENKSVNLAETNTALRVLLRQREEDKKVLESTIVANIKELVFPYVEKLRSGTLTEKQIMYVSMIESNLNDVISPFLQKINTVFERLTPMEVQVANMIRGGKTSKEIAEVLNISKGTVDGYRNSIRDKLGLLNRRVNLQTYLLSI
jgi:PAS domain S-box-containing protein